MKTFCFVEVKTCEFFGHEFMMSLITKRNQRHVSLLDISLKIITEIGNFKRCSREFIMLIGHVILVMLEFTLTITANTSTLSVEEVSKIYSFYIYWIY